ncbi:hypothetical protein DFH09DRAFT_1360560 [Mycena vulgaris]|nr:hypothetical protein DFH09DRAFT_1360560 [Mycena vulgaris]
MSSPPRLYEPQHCDTVTPPLFPPHHHHPSASSPPLFRIFPGILDYDLSPPLDLIVEVRAKHFAPLPPHSRLTQ